MRAVENVKVRSWKLSVKGLSSVSGQALVSAVIVVLTLAAPATAADEPKVLRVCADPDNLPFSNKHSEGFENKIAVVVARDLGATLEYYWWPHQRGLARNTLGAGTCDVLISIPKGYDPVLWTKPYYRSAYVLAQRNGRAARITSLDDPVLKQLKIGTYAGSPPYDALAERGLSANMLTYPLFFGSRVPGPVPAADEAPGRRPDRRRGRCRRLGSDRRVFRQGQIRRGEPELAAARGRPGRAYDVRVLHGCAEAGSSAQGSARGGDRSTAHRDHEDPRRLRRATSPVEAGGAGDPGAGTIRSRERARRSADA